MGGQWRKKKLMVVGSKYHARRRSYGLWAKKIKSLRKSLRKSKKEIIRKREDARHKETAELWRKVWETDGFDMGELRDHRYWGMHAFKGGEDCPIEVQLYAKLGLHRYNMLEGTNLQLHEIEKYNREGMYMPARYYITSLAEDPATQSLVTFQTELYERSFNTLKHTCVIARLKGTKSTGDTDKLRRFHNDSDLPEWPSFDDDKSSRFLYEVLESEWEENDWIGLYLEVAVVATDRQNDNPNLSGLKILNVVVETEENLPKETLLKCFRNVVVYITYDEDVGGDNGVCKRRAIVRRTVDLISKRFCLVGVTLPLLP